MQQTPKSSPTIHGKTPAIEFAPTNHQTGHGISHNEARNERIPSNPSSDRGDCSIDTTSAGCADQDGPDNEEADDQSGNAKDPAVCAPSDKLHVDEDQTGLMSHSSKISEIKGKGPIDSNFSPETSQLSSASHDAAVTEAASREEAMPNDEGDDDYNGVDLISESGDEKPSVEDNEEKVIIRAEGLLWDMSRPDSPTDAVSVASADWEEGVPSMGHLFSDDVFFEEQIGLFDPDACARDTEQYELATKWRSPTPTPANETPRRRVRFALTPPVETAAGSSAPFFPDLNNPGASASHGGDQAPPGPGTGTAEPSHTPDRGRKRKRTGSVPPTLRRTYRRAVKEARSKYRDDGETSSESLSGFETDDGDTTAEEDVPPSATFRPSAFWKSSSSAFNNRLAQRPSPKAPKSKLPPGHQWGPTLGTWVTDPRKPMAVVASSGKQLIVVPAMRPAKDGGKVFPTINSNVESSANASPVTPMSKTLPLPPFNTPTSEIERKEKASRDAATSILTAGSNLMLSGLGLGNGNMLSGHALGPPEAFFPFQSIGADGKLVVDGLEDTYDDDDDDDEDNLNLADFIYWGGNEEDGEDNDKELTSTADSRQSPVMGPSDLRPTESDPYPTPETSSPIHTRFFPISPHNLFNHTDKGSHNFSNHIDKSKVTAFRRNHFDYEIDYSICGDGVAGSSSQSFSNAIKSNAFVTTAAAMNSQKKRKMSGDFDALHAHTPTLTTPMIDT
ncbi:MAG: hypothetical protein Q9220_000219 [cf. Caloplaca sp. 1 TL-2023]